MPAKPAKRKPPPPPPAFPRVLETYGDPSWTLRNLRNAPTGFNGIVEIRKYRITVELVDEPVEVLRERLKKLWRENQRSIHLVHPMRVVALELGMDPKADLPSEEQGRDYKGRSGW